jgi:hypothetical protein
VATPQFNGVSDNAGVDELRDAYIGLMRYLTYFMSALDSQNIRVKGIEADRINVTELSAITANLGHITAGLIEAVTIIGSLIKTSNSYPRCEMSSTGNLLGAYYDANNSITIEPNYGGSPALNFSQGGAIKGRLDTLLGMELIGIGGLYVASKTSGDLNLDTDAGYVTVPSWSQLKNRVTTHTLQQDLDAQQTQISTNASNISTLQSQMSSKADAFTGYTGTIYVITDVDFVAQTTSAVTLNVNNGVITSVT